MLMVGEAPWHLRRCCVTCCQWRGVHAARHGRWPAARRADARDGDAGVLAPDDVGGIDAALRRAAAGSPDEPQVLLSLNNPLPQQSARTTATASCSRHGEHVVCNAAVSGQHPDCPIMRWQSGS